MATKKDIRNFNESLKNLIMVEMNNPQPALKLIESLRAGDVSPEFECFLIRRSNYFEMRLKNELMIANLRDFQLLFTKCIMYLLIAVLMALCFEIGASVISHMSFLYGALAFYIVVLASCYFYYAKMLRTGAAILLEYNRSLESLYKSIEAGLSRPEKSDTIL